MSLPNKYGWDRGSLAEPVNLTQECARRVRQRDDQAAKGVMSVYGKLRATLSKGYPEWMYESLARFVTPKEVVDREELLRRYLEKAEEP